MCTDMCTSETLFCKGGACKIMLNSYVKWHCPWARIAPYLVYYTPHLTSNTHISIINTHNTVYLLTWANSRRRQVSTSQTAHMGKNPGCRVQNGWLLFAGKTNWLPDFFSRTFTLRNKNQKVKTDTYTHTHTHTPTHTHTHTHTL